MLSVRPLEFNTAEAQGLRDLREMPVRYPVRKVVPWLLAAALVAGMVWLARGDDPESLMESRLVGPRSPVPLTVNVLLDESGSFTEYAAIRETVMRELAAWAPENLRGDDIVTVIGFADNAVIRLEPMTVAQLAASGARYIGGEVDAGDTNIQPALQAAASARLSDMPSTLVVVTDTEVSDGDRDDISTLARELGVTTMTTVLPEGADVADTWADAFAWGQVVAADPASVEETGVALARAIALATGQKVEGTRSRGF